MAVSIPEFFANRSVFITGATGFVGKALIEKLLRSCPQIGRIYLLIRPSKDKDAQSRLRELLKTEVRRITFNYQKKFSRLLLYSQILLLLPKVFEWLRQHQPEALNKLIPINGDVSLPDLGIKPSDMQLIEDNVSVVFNSAARVKFDYDLRSALDSNVKGPKTLAAFCRRLKNLKV